MKIICGIYKITNPKGRVYIGQSIDVRERMYRYKGGYCESQSRLHRSILKYGWEVHRFEIIHECNREQLNDLEIYYIDLFQCFNTEHGLNLMSGGHVSKMSDETKFKISSALNGKYVGEKSSCFGKKLSDEHKNKISIGNKGKFVSEETKVKMSLSQKERKYKPSDETRKIWSMQRKGRTSPNQGKKSNKPAWNKGLKGFGNFNKGKKMSKESCLKMSISKIGEGNVRSKIVIDLSNGIYYHSIREAAETIGMDSGALARRLSGRRKNKTSFIYA